jgi:hypothetical protein
MGESGSTLRTASHSASRLSARYRMPTSNGAHLEAKQAAGNSGRRAGRNEARRQMRPNSMIYSEIGLSHVMGAAA